MRILYHSPSYGRCARDNICSFQDKLAHRNIINKYDEFLLPSNHTTKEAQRKGCGLFEDDFIIIT